MPRLKPLAPETTPELKSYFDFFLGTLGFTPNSVLTMQRKPHLVKAFAELNAAVMSPAGEVDSHPSVKAHSRSGIVECTPVPALRSGAQLPAQYGAHHRLCGADRSRRLSDGAAGCGGPGANGGAYCQPVQRHCAFSGADTRERLADSGRHHFVSRGWLYHRDSDWRGCRDRPDVHHAFKRSVRRDCFAPVLACSGNTPCAVDPVSGALPSDGRDFEQRRMRRGVAGQ